MCDVQADHWVENWHRAKRRYLCDACARPIRKGERYCRTVCWLDGSCSVNRTHERCRSLCFELGDHGCVEFDLMDGMMRTERVLWRRSVRSQVPIEEVAKAIQAVW